MSTMFFYIILHPIVAFIAWLICGLVKHDYVRIALRSGVLAIVFTPTVAETASTEMPVSAISALLYGLSASPRPEVLIIITWIAVFMIGLILHLNKQKVQ